MANELSSAPDNTGQKQGTQFQAGQSGNPSGRPRGSRNKTTLAVQALLEGEAEAISRKVIEQAKEGDMQAIKLVLERILPPRKDAPVAFSMKRAATAAEVSEAMAELISAVSAGELAPSEGQAIASLLEQQRRCIETASLEHKLAALETILNHK